MNILQAIVLGLIQGLSEFLPVSSSGHLVLAEKIFGIADSGYFFTVMLHIGTLAAVLIVYRKRIWKLISHPVRQGKYWLWLIVSTLVTVIMAVVFKGIIDKAAEGGILGVSFILTSVMLLLCDIARKKLKRSITVPEMKWYQSAFIGFMQGIAILPGVSRSGATLTGAAFCEIKKSDAAEFSFLLSVPAILGGAVLELPAAIKEGAASIQWFPVIIGVAAAGISGFFAVKLMIRLITKHSFKIFVIYTALLGIFVMLDQFVFHIIAW